MILAWVRLSVPHHVAHPAIRIRMAVEIAQLLMQPLWNMWWMELLTNTLQIRAGKFDGFS